MRSLRVLPVDTLGHSPDDVLWVVIGPDGSVAGVAVLPYGARILDLSTDELAVLERGPMYEEYIVRYRRTRQPTEEP